MSLVKDWLPPLQAAKIWKNYGHGSEAILRLTSELQHYKAGRPPFDLQASVVDFQPRLYWESLRSAEYTHLPSLAIIMFDITPHAGEVERVFSMMGWMQNDKRNRLRTDTLEMMAKVKTYHNSLRAR